MTDKYGNNFDSQIIQKNVNRLTNQIWKLIPMRENHEPWENQIVSVLTEIIGLNELFDLNENILILLSKLEGLRALEMEFYDYRKCVFECITLLREGFKEHEN